MKWEEKRAQITTAREREGESERDLGFEERESRIGEEEEGSRGLGFDSF